MKRALVMLLFLCVASPAFAQDASTAWRTIISKCAKSDLLGRESLFFGVSNLIGPGSIWRRADDGSIRLVSVLSDVVTNADDESKIVLANNIVACTGNSKTGWNIKFGLPFSTGATALSLDIGAILGGAHSVTVSVKGYAMDTLDEDNWKKAFLGLGQDNIYLQDARQPNRLLAENAVKVTGLTAVFNFNHDFSGDVQAKYNGKSFMLGNNSSNGNSTSTTSKSPGSTPAKTGPGSAEGGSGATSTAGTGQASSASAASASGGSSTPGACSSGSSAGAGSGTTSTGGAGASASSGNGVATLHVEFSGSKQITICADGPFYVMAAYSNLQFGNPIGIAPTQASLQIIPNAQLPKNASAASDRKQ